MKLLIAVPCLDMIPVEFVQSMNALIRRLDRDGIDFEVRYEAGTLVYLARDSLAFYASQNCFTHVLWLDSDMVFPDNIYHELKAVNADIVTGVCRSRHGSHELCLYESFDKRLTEVRDKPFPVKMCGFACVLTATTVLEHIGDKYDKHPFCPTQFFGEDLQFCVRADGMGYRIMCQPSVKVGHIARSVIWPDKEE